MVGLAIGTSIVEAFSAANRPFPIDGATYEVTGFSAIIGTGFTLYTDVGVYGVDLFNPWMYFSSYEGPHFKTIYIPPEKTPLYVKGQRQIIMVPYEKRDADVT